MKFSLSILNFASLGKLSLITASIALASCAASSEPHLLSRLPPSDPAAAATSPKQLSKAERKRYAEIDQQVLAEQERAIAEDAARSAIHNYYAYPPMPILYGSYYRRSPRWGVGLPFGSGLGWGAYGRPGWGW